jgi:hypothetical protein
VTPTLELLLPVAAAAIGEALKLDSPHVIAMSNDFATLVNTAASGADTTAAIESLAATLVGVAATHSTNQTIVDAAAVVSNFAPAQANFLAGQAVVLASPSIEGHPALIVLVEKGGEAAGALGV